MSVGPAGGLGHFGELSTRRGSSSLIFVGGQLLEVAIIYMGRRYRSREDPSGLDRWYLSCSPDGYIYPLTQAMAKIEADSEATCAERAEFLREELGYLQGFIEEELARPYEDRIKESAEASHRTVEELEALLARQRR